MANWVYDIETLSNCFAVVFEDHKDNLVVDFVVHRLRDDRARLLSFLENSRDSSEWYVSYNGLAFDSQVIEYILRNKSKFMAMTADEAARDLYNRAQEVIWNKNKGGFSEYAEWKLSIKHIDIFKLNHWDNKAKSSSLKWVQFSMDWDNVQDMPIHHSTEITTYEQIDEIISYCRNDVRSTKKIMYLSRDQIKLRNALSKEHKLNLRSASEPKIAREIFLKFLSEKSGIDKYELKSMRTIREMISGSDILLPWIEFTTRTFKDLKERFMGLTIDPGKTKEAFKYSIRYKGVKTDFGLGGVHGANKPGVYEADENMLLLSCDVVSFYPRLAIVNQWSPAHLPKEVFCDTYKWFFDERVKIPKTDQRNYVYKIILNSAYGQANDANSFLYDPQFAMSITLNGQLALMMLYEMICESIPGTVPLMQNTDGLELMIPATRKEQYMDICRRWEQLTKLDLEHTEYRMMAIADVNNYIAVYKEPGKVAKCKGRFEWEDLEKKKVAVLHKNKSCLVVSKALYEFFVNGVDPKDYIESNKNIFDYCTGVKAKSGWEFIQTQVENGEVVERKLQKVNRYYVSNKGCKIIKHNTSDDRTIQTESGHWLLTLYNTHRNCEWKDYDVNIKYYLEKIYKEIETILPSNNGQLSLDL